jgi:hypothetical protein
VTGKDGKPYPATRPTIENPPRGELWGDEDDDLALVLQIVWEGGHQADQKADANEHSDSEKNEYLSHAGYSDRDAIGLV